MKAAIIGLPQAGKSTLFTAATGTLVDSFAPPEPRAATVRVPDPRLTHLTSVYKPKKTIEATMELVDIPGCLLSDAKGQQEWRRFLPSIRQADLLVVVVRMFEDPSQSPTDSKADPGSDFQTMWEELIFADLDAVTTRCERLESALKKPTKTHDAEKKEMELLARCREALEASEPLSAVVRTDDERKQVSSFAFLTEKPILCVLNLADGQDADSTDWKFKHVKETVAICGSLESEVAQLDPEDRPAFLEELGIDTPARDRLIQACYQAAGLISFLTVGTDEVRAWPIAEGTTAVGAASKIHTDIAKGFIRAETVSYDDLVAHGDMKGAKSAGRVRKEGKTYVVHDGDILNILTSA